MKKTYEQIQVENDYDDENNINVNPHINIPFESNLTQDNKYFYKIRKETDEDYIDEGVDIDYYYKNKKLIRSLHQYLSNNSPKDLIITDIKKLKLINDQDINKSVKGIRDLDWKLHCWFEYEIDKNNITLHDLIIACYKIKSRKFDIYHEKFYRLKNFCVFNSYENGKNVKEIIAVVKYKHFNLY
ncbi:hypothetical protein H012_gp049 [Acanthamoeba polyphaga moumouvirus]|uniref:Uncharacterized protein n=1 Tax=Acanthamoeba polyphaga moumouvirus TaxID=1269028 RepID=L7RCQ4_9VIRU|nr:hypothetical protein H012_gp049 [Acanthamoeba polyphaga moumouvirus]AGC02399.1 hypothetical protein Moumou_00884 [Acanthamoeba polyphaga moumouvirus]